jgi:hypothetical protein
MQLKGIDLECKSNAMALAFKRSGYKLLNHRAKWPRIKGASAVKIDVKTGTAVGFVRRDKNS